MAFFCPVCFGQSEGGGRQCLQCGTNLLRWSETHSYTERLVQALQHPIAEVRMGAVIAIGLRRDTQAARALADCALAHAADIPEGFEIVRSLARLAVAAEAVASLQWLAAEHPARAVRAAARKALMNLPV